MPTLIADDKNIRPPIKVTRHTLPHVACAVFACARCNWPLVGAKFTFGNYDDFHEEVFELGCRKCGWREAVLGRDALDRMIVNWNGRTITRVIQGV